MMGSRRYVSLRGAAVALLALAASSCDEAEPAGPAPAISIALSTGTVTVTQGQTGSVTVTLTRQNGFADAVAVTVEGLPTGVTVPALSLPASSTSGTLTFTAATTAVVGTTPLTVRATGPSVTAATQSLSLVVQAAQPAGAFTLSLSPASLSVAQGASGSTTVTITRTGSFTGAVALTATGVPAGVTPTFNPASVTTPNTSTLTLAASATATTGTANVTITGTGTGVTNQTVTLALTVTAVATGSFTLAVSPTTLSVQQGQSASTTVTIARVGAFTGAVALTATGLPAGVTPSFNPASVTATTSTLTLTASPTATTGTVNVTVTGTGTGVANVTSTLGLTVTAAPSGGGNVSVAFCPSIGVPLWVAFQDGTGAWTQSTLVNGLYSGTVNSGRGGVAYVTAVSGGGYQTNVRYGTTAELQAFNQVFCYGNTGTGKTVNVTVAGTSPTDIAFLALGTAASSAFPGVPTSPFSNVPDGTLDLLGARGALNVQTGAITLNKLFAQRGITPAANSTVNVDFAGANAIDPVTGTITIGNLGTDQALVAGQYLSANRTSLSYAFDTPSTAATRSFGGFPASAGSFHLIQVQAVPNFQNFTSLRASAVVASTVGNRTINLGSDLGTVNVTAVSTTPVMRPQAVIPVGAYTGSWSASYTQGSAGANYRAAAVQQTAGYVGGSPTSVTLTLPDLSAGGFQALWGMFDATTTWSVTGQAVNGFGAQGQWQDGATLLFALRTGTLSSQQEEEQRQQEE